MAGLFRLFLRQQIVRSELVQVRSRYSQGIFVPLSAMVDRRVQTVSGDGANLAGVTDTGQFIEALRPATVLGSLGARMLTGLREDIAIPKMDSPGPAAEWLETEGSSALTGGDHSFTQVTDDGLIGRSRLQRAAAVVQAGLSIQTFANSLYENGANPSRVLELAGKLSDQSFQYLVQRFRDVYSGPQHAAKVMVLDQGLTWKQVSVRYNGPLGGCTS